MKSHGEGTLREKHICGSSSIWWRIKAKGTTVGNKKANSEKKIGTVYLSLFSEKVVLCVVFVVCCVV